MRCLVVANRTLGGAQLLAAIGERLAADPGCSFHVLVPATPSRGIYEGVLAAYAGDLPDPASAAQAAERRLADVLTWLHAEGHQATGEIGDLDPLVAVEDVLAREHFDEIIVSTLPARVSRWLALDLANRVRRAVDVPVTHVEGPPAREG